MNKSKIITGDATQLNTSDFLHRYGVIVADPPYANKEHFRKYGTLFMGNVAQTTGGFALSFVLGRWRLLKTGSGHWWILLIFVLSLAFTLPLVAVPYLLSEQNSQPIAEVFQGLYWLQIAWSGLAAGVPALIIMAVGFADVDEADRVVSEQASKGSSESGKLPGKR